MITLEVNKSLLDVKTMLIASSLKLTGYEIDQFAIEDCLFRDKFTDLSLKHISSIITYNNIIEFLQKCKENQYKIMTSCLAIAICNYMLRDFSIDTPYLRTDVSVPQIQNDLDNIFKKAHESVSVSSALKVLLVEIYTTKFITMDLGVFIYLVINFFLYTFKGSVVIFNDQALSRSVSRDDIVYYYFDQLCTWVKTLEE